MITYIILTLIFGPMIVVGLFQCLWWISLALFHTFIMYGKVLGAITFSDAVSRWFDKINDHTDLWDF